MEMRKEQMRGGVTTARTGRAAAGGGLAVGETGETRRPAVGGRFACVARGGGMDNTTATVFRTARLEKEHFVVLVLVFGKVQEECLILILVRRFNFPSTPFSTLPSRVPTHVWVGYEGTRTTGRVSS